MKKKKVGARVAVYAGLPEKGAYWSGATGTVVHKHWRERGQEPIETFLTVKMDSGDFIPAHPNQLRLLKKSDRKRLREKMRAYWDSEPYRKERAIEFFTKLDLSKIDETLSFFRDADEVQDRTYRIYHHSFKMYHFRYTAFLLFSKVLALVGDNFPVQDTDSKTEDVMFSTIIGRLEYWSLDEELITILKELLAAKFDLEKQHDDGRWVRDTKILTSGYFLAKEVTLALLLSLKDVKEQKAGFLWEPGLLNTHDALTLEVWNSLGSAFRYNSKNIDEILEKCRQIIRSK